MAGAPEGVLSVGMEQKNRFSTLLEQLVATAEVKHATLAKALQYDVSYISKWIGGRVLPTEKSASDILQKISRSLVENASEAGLAQLERDYEVKLSDELWQAIYDNLIAEYYYVLDLQQSSGSVVAPNISFFPELSMKKFMTKMSHPVLRRVSSLNIMAAIDLFSIANEFRLQVVNLGNNNPMDNRIYPDVRFSLLINLDKATLDPIHNALFISNMLANSSRVDFQLYCNDFAHGKVMFVVKQDFAITGMLIRPNTCAAVTVCEGKENSTPLYNDIQSLCTRETLLFSRMSMREIVYQSMEYVYSLLVPDRQWFLGHLTEHLLPADLFEEIAVQVLGSDRAGNWPEVVSIHNLTQRILDCGNVQLLICESAISRFVVTGELDFFNHKLVLNFEQRKRVIEHFRTFLKEFASLRIRMVHEPLISDSQYSSSPSVFLSSTISYLRLCINWADENLLLRFNRVEMKELYGGFFREIWNSESHVVSDREEIDRFVNHLLQSLDLLATVKDGNPAGAGA